MVFEQFLASKKVKTHALFIFAIGFFYAAVGYIVSSYFFMEDASIVMLFTITLLLTPSIFVLLNIEEKIERKEGTKHFFRNHKTIMKAYLFLFLGIFLAFVIFGHFSGESFFTYQLDFLHARGDISTDVLNDFASTEYTRGFNDLTSLVSYDLFVVVVCFVLSVFYGAGALFLIALNASVFAAFIVSVGRIIGNPIPITSLFLIHMVPEIDGFLTAAIECGIVSIAIMKEKVGSDGFRNVMKDALVLLLIAAGLIIIGAFLELFVTAPLAKMLF